MDNDRLLQTELFLINFRYFSKLMDKKFKCYLRKNGVDTSEFIFLLLLNRKIKGLSMVELTKLSKVDKSMTTKVVKKMEEKAYIYRDRDNENERNYKICLTELGIEKASKSEKMLCEESKKFADKFTLEEQKMLKECCKFVLHKYIENND